LTPPAAGIILRSWQSAALAEGFGRRRGRWAAVAVDGQAQTARPLRRCLAAWLGILLALAPFARPALPADLAPVRGAAGFLLVAQDDGMAQAREPAPRLRPAQPLAPGVLARWSWLDTKLGPAPAKPPLARLSASDPLPPAAQALGAPTGEIRQVFDRSSVGTARRPTGPPS
jgi:hypothetical protein